MHICFSWWVKGWYENRDLLVFKGASCPVSGYPLVPAATSAGTAPDSGGWGAWSEQPAVGRRAARGLPWCLSVWSVLPSPTADSFRHLLWCTVLPQEQWVPRCGLSPLVTEPYGIFVRRQTPGSPANLLHQNPQGWAPESTLTDGLSMPTSYTLNLDTLSFWKFDFVLGVMLLLLLSCFRSCPTLCDPIDGSLPCSSVPGILQARTLEWVAISFSNTWKWKVKVKLFSRVWLFETPWTAAYQAPPSKGFSRQEYWSRLPLPSLPWSHKGS